MTQAAGSETSSVVDLKPAKRQRIAGLDILRGLAAFSVVIYHYTSNFNRNFGHRNGEPLFTFPLGGLGVQLFFIISGFVIFMTLENTKKPMDFVRSRFSRLYPAYWGALLFAVLLLKLVPFPPTAAIEPAKYNPSLVRAVVNITMCQELLGVGHVDGVYWTLQLELCFYLLMFVLFVSGLIRRVEWCLLGVIALGELVNYSIPDATALASHGRLVQILVSDLRLFLLTIPLPGSHSQMHLFLTGIVIYKLARKFDPMILAVGLVCLAYSFWRDFGRSGTDFYSYMIFSALIYSAARGWLNFLENPVLIFLGTISYSLYLVHQNLGYRIIVAMEDHGFTPNASIVVAIGGALLVASILNITIEKPALKLLRGKKQPQTK